MRISRSSRGISFRSALRKVVLPVEVPPATTMFLRAFTAARRKAAASPASSRARSPALISSWSERPSVRRPSKAPALA
jgi:hypothetical protein